MSISRGAKFSFDNLVAMRQHLEAVLENSSDWLSENYSNAPLVLLGSGSLYAQPFVSFAFEKLKVVALVDNLRSGQIQGDLTICGDSDLSAILDLHPQAIGVLCCQSDGATGHFAQVWQATGRPLLNMFEVMRASGFESGEHYYSHFQNKSEIAHIYQHCWPYFKDIESQRSFLSLLLFRATLAQPWLEAVRLPYKDMYFFTSGLGISDTEVFVDAGSFDGDSLVHFLRRVDGRYRHIHALEPDPLNFELLERNFGHADQCSLHQCGLWSHDMQTQFQIGGLGSRMDVQAGEVPVQLRALDDLGLGEVTLLKMDIEGAEAPALAGACRTLQSFKPKLAIAAYHKAHDLPVLIDDICALRDDYQFTLRHHSPFFRDTVLMAQ